MTELSTTNNERGKLLVHEATPKFKIVGTYHSLTDEDKVTLESLIEESDFVSLEWDKESKKNSNLIHFDIDKEKRYDPCSNTLYVNKLNYFFLIAFSKLIRLNIKVTNYFSGRENVDYNEIELQFCYKAAKRRKKDIYLVDIPLYESLSMLCDFSFKEKMGLLLCLSTFGGFNSKSFKAWNMTRESEMINSIEKNEGCSIYDLNRKGILVTGYSHAQDYISRQKKNGKLI